METDPPGKDFFFAREEMESRFSWSLPWLNQLESWEVLCRPTVANLPISFITILMVRIYVPSMLQGFFPCKMLLPS